MNVIAPANNPVLIVVLGETVAPGLDQASVSRGWQLLKFSSVSDAIREVFRHRPQVVIVQVSLQSEAVKFIGTLHKAIKPILLIAVAAEHHNDLERAVRGAGINYYLPGASNVELLEQAVAAVLMGHRHGAPAISAVGQLEPGLSSGPAYANRRDHYDENPNPCPQSLRGWGFQAYSSCFLTGLSGRPVTRMMTAARWQTTGHACGRPPTHKQWLTNFSYSTSYSLTELLRSGRPRQLGGKLRGTPVGGPSTHKQWLTNFSYSTSYSLTELLRSGRPRQLGGKPRGTPAGDPSRINSG